RCGGDPLSHQHTEDDPGGGAHDGGMRPAQHDLDPRPHLLVSYGCGRHPDPSLCISRCQSRISGRRPRGFSRVTATCGMPDEGFWYCGSGRILDGLLETVSWESTPPSQVIPADLGMASTQVLP